MFLLSWIINDDSENHVRILTFSLVIPDMWLRHRALQYLEYFGCNGHLYFIANNPQWVRYHQIYTYHLKCLLLWLLIKSLGTGWSWFGDLERQRKLHYPKNVPAGTRRNNNVFTTSTRRRRRRVDVVKTLSLRHYCVMCPLGISNTSWSVCGSWNWSIIRGDNPFDA